MKTKNFLMLAAVMTAMAITSVMMTSCTANEDNTVVLPDIPGDVPGGDIPADGAPGDVYNVGYKVDGAWGEYNLGYSPGQVYGVNYSEDFDGFDASEYEYVWIKFSGSMGKFRFGVIYNEWKDTDAWGETFYEDAIDIEDEEGIAFIKIEKEKIYKYGGPDEAASLFAGDTWDKHIRMVCVHPVNDWEAIDVTIEGIWFGSEEDFDVVRVPEYWQELRAALEQADRIMTEAQNNTKVEMWMTEELGNFIERANEMYNEKTASEAEIHHMIEELSWITMEVKEAMKS